MSGDSEDGTFSVDDVTVTEPSIVRRAVTAAATGNVTEWYDFGVYAYLEPTIEKVFLPPETPGGPVIVAGLFASSFLVRPLGGLFFGPLGDRIGRTKVLSITMIMMALGTFAIGVIPDYAQAGVLAAFLLLFCRLVQGFSTGGEYGGAMTFIAEYSPDRRRGYLGSWLEFGTLTGYLLGAGVVTILQTTFGEDSEFMLSWGWRIPFFVALPLGIVGLYLRSRLEETPAFAALQEESEGKQSEQSLGQFFKIAATYWRPVLVCLGLVIAFNVTNYMLTTVVPTYLTETLGEYGQETLSTTQSQVLQIITLAVLLLLVPLLGRLSDRVGRRPIVLTGCVLLVVLSLPSVLLLQSGSIVGVFGGLVLMGLMLVCFNSTMPSTLPALFTTGIRYGTLSIAFNVAVSMFGGTTSVVIQGLISATGNLEWPAYYLMAAGVIGAIAIFSTRESNARPLPGSHPSAANDEEARELVGAQR
jgi:MHS family proline/betaine transporter-like MFS transporter